MKWGEIDPQSTWLEFKALTTTLSSSDVLMIKIVFQKIEKKNLAPPEKPEIKH